MEKQLKDAELKAIAFSTMVDIAERELIFQSEKVQYQTIEAMKNNFSHIGLAVVDGWTPTGLSKQLGRIQPP
ncbi:MAG: hypothetical protein IPQ03_09325 [Bacteroidetes bacterium]|nr:hypothetical protein [Bacteroidota bacterium]